ncbi:ATP-binding cassette domain-containing protein [Gilvimarinus sp. SDUM040013]|uniref:ATP-binding cassette domain-containing protein n=1 Tax=Gilvimarinus gilvus TaxID=3058038 RepID=A0ABU4S6J9_9GAMM|nr:ATP-binding cassette domain-containing protein [Gilvimarinus sp. SDUM040013]MDO3384399.1 ATP-binding cassette domain-containing protein [Gilvimarinus sp. SDUM040013]MDX6851004.1 ATP-binding cassette domain-containing protein [Gilvimarinus sp. SDUM040013]
MIDREYYIDAFKHQPLTPANAVAMVGLEHRRHRFPAQPSGGEQQRVAITRAIARRPTVRFYDGPTGALHSTIGRVVLQVFNGFSQGDRVVLYHGFNLLEGMRVESRSDAAQ